ncbi:MAG: primosomal protein N' [Oscillospiraceae bacterium]|nr:primosomal protein N' [Oscillospiraceae bacterium]
MAEKFAKIAVSDVTYWLDKPYAYRIPDEFSGKVEAGMRVAVPFSKGNRRSEGVVLAVTDECEWERPKPILEVLDTEPVMTPRQMALALWMRERFFCTVYEAVRAMLPAGLWFTKTGKRKVADSESRFLRLAVPPEEALAAAAAKRARAPHQAAVLELMSAVGEGMCSEIKLLSGAGAQTIKALIEKGLIEDFYCETFRRPEYREGAKSPLPQLNAAQNGVLDGLNPLLDGDEAACALILGVTGSGKTAVYIHLIRRALEQGKSAMLLVPEIALTPQLLQTMSSYFGEDIAVLHSGLTMAERYDEWKRIRQGLARLVLGTRSAVFAPCENLGLVIIDEEQDESYKSESAPRYHARDVALYRCAEEKALLLLGSATPSMESRYAAETGRYKLFCLSERFNRKALPSVSIVDMKQELRAGNPYGVSSFLRGELQRNIELGQQSILFINRRGASKIVTCGVCGFSYTCPNCSVSLTWHSVGSRLVCHWCGYTRRVDACCPDCGGELKYIGEGTQKIESELGELFPNVPVLRMDTDTVTEAGSHEALLERFQREKIPIMIGTKMVTKGLNFANVTLVGVISADQSLYSGDFRAAERTFSLITQVIGRSGRSLLGGRAVIQTFTPENPVIKLAAKQDYNAFYLHELEIRRMQQCPPFTALTVLTVTGANEALVLRCCNEIKRALDAETSRTEGLRVLGPAPYPVVKVKNSYRYRITVAGARERLARPLCAQILQYFNNNKEFRGVSVYADLNPNE